MVFLSIGTYLTGAFGQSQQVYRVRNEAKRGRGSQELVDKQIIEDTKTIIEKQKESGLTYIMDPLLNTYYLFQSFVKNVSGVKAGPQENWFNNNVFFWRPQISYPLKPSDELFSKNIHFDLLPDNGIALAVLPSPYTLFILSDIEGCEDKKIVENLGEIIYGEARKLADRGVGRIQFDEPAIVYKQSLGSLTEEDIELLEIGMNQFAYIEASTSLNTYFGDASPILPTLVGLPVDCIGIDATETKIEDILGVDFSQKELALGLIDARSPSVENPASLVEKLKLVEKHSKPKKSWLTPNTGTEYIGWTLGLEKINVLKETVRMFENE